MCSAPTSAFSRLSVALIGIALAVAACTSAPQASSSAVPGGGPISIAVGSRPGVPAVGAGAIWVPNTGDGTVSRIDPRTNRVIATIAIGDSEAFYHRSCEAYGSVHSFMVTTFDVRLCDLPSAVAAGPGVVWVLRNDTQDVLRIDPSTNRITASIPLGAAPWDLTATADAVWVTSFLQDQVIRVDPALNRVVHRFSGFSHGPTGLAVAGDTVWVASTFGSAVTRIDTTTNRVVAVIPIPCATSCLAGPRPLAIAVTPEEVWVRSEGNGTLARIDPARDVLTDTVPIDAFYGRDGLDHMGTTPGSLWVGGVSLQQRDRHTGRLIRHWDQAATAVTASGSTVWFTDILGRVGRIDGAP
jgi:YVTN family beta-propeller protein